MKVVDPVCKMEIDKESTKYVSEYMGQLYYFDSEMCMHEFEDDPEAYAGVVGGRIYTQHGDRLDGSE